MRTKEENCSEGILMYVKKKILVGCKRIVSHFKDYFCKARQRFISF